MDETDRYMYLVKKRMAYLQDQLDRRLPAYIRQLDERHNRLHRLGHQDLADEAASDLSRAMTSLDDVTSELESGARVVSLCDDVQRAAAQAQIRADDDQLRRCRQSFLRTASEWAARG